MSRRGSAPHPLVGVVIDGQKHDVPSGTSIAAALLAVGHPDILGVNTVFCGMGSCYGCVATVDGRPGVRTCITPVEAGMRLAPERGAERHG